jgi:hypothetical protein
MAHLEHCDAPEQLLHKYLEDKPTLNKCEAATHTTIHAEPKNWTLAAA